MSATARERIATLVSGKEQIHPFDFVNNTLFYDPVPEADSAYAKRLLAQTRIANLASTAVSRNLKFVFVPGSMSNGARAYDLVERNKEKLGQLAGKVGLLTTQNIKRQVASSQLLNEVILPNRIANHQYADDAERQLPDYAVVAPADAEGPWREIYNNPALSQGATFQDWTFEAYWGPRVIDSAAMVLTGDHAYSRYANVEETIGDLIQCGLLDDYRQQVGPGRQYKIMDEKGEAVSLTDRAWETAKHIVHVVERGFKTDLAVAALIVRFQIDDWLNDPENSPLDMSKVHPSLKRRSAREIEMMAALKQVMLPYLANCLDWVPWQKDPGLKAYVEKNVLPARGEFTVSQDIFLLQHAPKGGYVETTLFPPQEDGLKSSFAASARPAKRRGVTEGYFADSTELFDDKQRLYKTLGVWEQAALGFIAGSMEAHRLPESAPRAFFYSCEPKGGAVAREWADRNGVVWLREAQNAADPLDEKNFTTAVIEKNIRRDEKTVAKLMRDPAAQFRQVKNIVSTLDILEIDAAVQENREFVAAPGPNRLSGDARLALQMEWFDRNAEGLVLRKGWQYHPHEVQMMVRAVLHATGLAARPYEGGKYRMEIFVDEPGTGLQKQDLYDLITTLAETVEQQLDSDAPPPDRESYLSCARLLEIVDKLADPGLLNKTRTANPQTGKVSAHDIIEWLKVDSDLYRFWNINAAKRASLSATQDNASESLRDRLRRKILDKGVFSFAEQDLNGLHDEYRKAWTEAQGKMSLQARPDTKTAQTRHLKFEGPTS